MVGSGPMVLRFCMLLSLWLTFIRIFIWLLCIFKRDPLTFILVSTFFLSVAGTVGLGQLFIYVSDYIQSSAANSSVSAASSSHYISSSPSPYYYPISSYGHSTSRLLETLSQVLSNGTTRYSDSYSSFTTAMSANVTSYPSTVYYNDISSLAFTSPDSFNSSFTTSNPSSSLALSSQGFPSCSPVPRWDDMSVSFPGDWASLSYYAGLPTNYCEYKRISASWWNGLLKLGTASGPEYSSKFARYSRYVYEKEKFYEEFYKNLANINSNPIAGYFPRLFRSIRRSIPSSTSVRSASQLGMREGQAIACLVVFVALKFLLINIIG